MKSLAGGDETDAGIAERGGFRGAIDADEARVSGKIFFAGLAHFLVGFHAEDGVAIFQEQLGEKPVPEPMSAMACLGESRHCMRIRSRTSAG